MGSEQKVGVGILRVLLLRMASAVALAVVDSVLSMVRLAQTAAAVPPQAAAAQVVAHSLSADLQVVPAQTEADFRQVVAQEQVRTARQVQAHSRAQVGQEPHHR